ncbi:MAG: hypothetical protein ACT4OM_08950 [Actinomycetota bacterium]
MNDDPEQVGAANAGDEPAERQSWRHVYMDRRAQIIAALFVLATGLTFLVSVAFAALLVVPVALSLAGARRAGDGADRLRTTGEVMVFNGVVLMVSLLLVGFIRDFLLASPAVLDNTVAFAYTTVHVMLGLGLFFFDFRTLNSAGKTAD